MDDMTPPNATEIAVELAKEATTRKILAMVKEAKDKEEIVRNLEDKLEK
ncbi:MAG: hypothetical protein FWB87_13770 [Defluviitaleaceae bacterium]|nr:hypothetical protein [Defluviitaleaceae bacterium]